MAGASSFERWSQRAVSLTVANRALHPDHERRPVKRHQPSQSSVDVPARTFVAWEPSQMNCIIGDQFNKGGSKTSDDQCIVDAVQKCSSRRRSVSSREAAIELCRRHRSGHVGMPCFHIGFPEGLCNNNSFLRICRWSSRSDTLHVVQMNGMKT